MGSRRIITRQALAEFLGLPPEEEGTIPTQKPNVKAKEEVDEWTYVVTVKRLRRGEKVRVEAERETLGRWGR